MPASAVTSASTKKAMDMVRQRATSPGEPGCWATLVKDRTSARRAKKKRVAARM